MPTTNTLLDTPFGALELHRYPKPAIAEGKQQPLRAWDAADEYLLGWLAQHLNEPSSGTDRANNNQDERNALILNDSFGALSVALSHLTRWSQSDSYLAQQGCRANLQTNSDAAASASKPITLLNSLEWPTQTMQLVVIKIPKTLALLEHQLYHLRPLINPESVIVAAGMTKNIHRSTLALFERIIGPTKTSLAQKKARLIFTQPQPQQWHGNSPYPSQYFVPELDVTMSNHANVFSRASLDIGSRLLLDHYPKKPSITQVIDLGCGNGLLGLKALQIYPQAQVHFIDESYMAVDSARHNVEAVQGSTQRAQFHVGNSLTTADIQEVDLVLCNPPFHQQSVVGDHIAWQMFQDARRALRPGGELRIIGNRHLDYHLKLKRLFKNCTTVASDRKFVVLSAIKA